MSALRCSAYQHVRVRRFNYVFGGTGWDPCEALESKLNNGPFSDFGLDQ